MINPIIQIWMPMILQFCSMQFDPVLCQARMITCLARPNASFSQCTQRVINNFVVEEDNNDNEI